MEMLQEVAIECPSCGEASAIEVETSIAEQSYFEDCPVCCRPMEIFVRCRPGEILSLSITGDD